MAFGPDTTADEIRAEMEKYGVQERSKFQFIAELTTVDDTTPMAVDEASLGIYPNASGMTEFAYNQAKEKVPEGVSDQFRAKVDMPGFLQNNKEPLFQDHYASTVVFENGTDVKNDDPRPA